MQTLLRIDSSARIKGSHTRQLGDYIEDNWRKANPQGRVVYRDLVRSQLPHIHNDTIIGYHTPADQMTDQTHAATALSDQLIAELKSADEILITSPLYNLNVPSSLKAYFDQTIRINRTFELDEKGYHGLLTGKVAYLATAKGEVYKGTHLESLDFQEPYLQGILGFMGIQVRKTFSLEGTADIDSLASTRQQVYDQIDAMFKLQNN